MNLTKPQVETLNEAIRILDGVLKHNSDARTSGADGGDGEPLDDPDLLDAIEEAVETLHAVVGSVES